MNPNSPVPPRLLVVDDNPTIHEDFRKILGAQAAAPDSLVDLEAAFFGAAPSGPERAAFEMDSAYQGREALSQVEQALRSGQPFSLAFVDMRMPPGWDGVETISHLWRADPRLQIVICTAYSDYSWDEIIQQLGRHDNLVILKKPFDNIEVLQLAQALVQKWIVTEQLAHLASLHRQAQQPAM